MRTIAAAFIAALVAVPAAAQVEPPKISFRPFFVVTGEQMAAKTAFNAAFGGSFQPFFGGGVQLAFRDGLFVEVGASRFSKTGEQAYYDQPTGRTYTLGIAQTVTITPFEVSAGYRARPGRLPHVVPYVGAGLGSYGYTQTSDFANSGENVDTRHVGFLVLGGAEFRLHRWIGVGVDAQYTHVPGILGAAGLSQAAGENDLGGIAVRLKVLVGR